ncbi:MAG: hypothetical protein UHJ46_02630, partial [Treponema sp.]|nr:hypothetical protein [Treponema sp.]
MLIYTCSFGVNKTATPILPAIEITPKIVFINPLIIKTRPRINAIEIKQKSIEENIHHSQNNCKEGSVPKVMSVALIEPFDRWFLSLSKGSGTTRQNDCYTKCGSFDKL